MQQSVKKLQSKQPTNERKKRIEHTRVGENEPPLTMSILWTVQNNWFSLPKMKKIG